MISNDKLRNIRNYVETFNYSSFDLRLDLYLLHKNRVIPYNEDDYSIFCISDHFNNNIISNIEYLTKKDCKVIVLSTDEINSLLDIFHNKIKYCNNSNKLKLFKIESIEDKNNESIISYLNDLIEYSINNNVTDIHIEPFFNNIRIRTRIDGALHVKDYISKDAYSVVITRIKVLSKLDISERRLPQDGRITFSYQKKDIDLRISLIPTIYGEKITIRLLDSENRFISLNSLGLLNEDVEYIKREIKKSNGMILVCGPTNSGKTTTIYSILNEVNKEDVNIITLEDPVEYKIYGINQIQINNKQGLKFNNTLRNILRADPELISIGEMRDEETVQTGLRAAITGHYVFSTLHTPNCISAIFRLKDMNAKEYLISSALNTIISQRLVKVLCQDCKTISYKDLSSFGINVHYEPNNCPKCNNGYKGRIGVFELLKIDDSIKALVNNNSSYNEILQKARENGFITLSENLIDTVNKGISSFDEILKFL